MIRRKVETMKFLRYFSGFGIGVLIGCGVLIVMGLEPLEILTGIPIAIGLFMLIYVTSIRK